MLTPRPMRRHNSQAYISSSLVLITVNKETGKKTQLFSGITVIKINNSNLNLPISAGNVINKSIVNKSSNLHNATNRNRKVIKLNFRY